MTKTTRAPRASVLAVLLAAAGPGAAGTTTYTFDADFDQGVRYNVDHDPTANQLELQSPARPLPYIWIAVSVRGTVAKIDVETGAVLGEYLSSPDGMGRDPSRTTVDRLGNVWVGSREEATPSFRIGEDGRPFTREDGSATKIGLLEAGQCVDRNGDGLITTSRGLGDVLPWTNAGGVDGLGGVATAADECILLYVRVDPPHVRQVSVDLENHAWIGGDAIGGLPERKFQRLDGRTGAILRTIDLNDPADTGQPPLFTGPWGPVYGGFVDCHGHLWSTGHASGFLVRVDPARPNGDPDLVARYDLGRMVYGIGHAPDGHVWISTMTWNTLYEFDDALNLVSGPHPTTGPPIPPLTGGARGVAVSPHDGNVWVANAGDDTVTRHAPDGSIRAVVPVGHVPIGVAIDTNGKTWVANRNSNDVMRIDPDLDAVDLTVPLDMVGHPVLDLAMPYNYSDMTGIVSLTALPFGRWSIVTTAPCDTHRWTSVGWNGIEPPGTRLVVEARSAPTPATLESRPFVGVTNGGPLADMDDLLLETRVSFVVEPGFGCGSFPTPVLLDLTVRGEDTVAPSISCAADLEIACGDALPAPEAPVTFDACGPVALRLEERVETGPCGGSSRVIRRWIAADPDGNETSCEQLVEATDETAPVLLGVPASATVPCDAVPPPAVVTAEDACEGPLPVVFRERREGVACADSYRLVRTWSADDGCGNEGAAEQVIDVRDGGPPALAGVPADVVLACGTPVPPAPAVTATDDCDPAPRVVLVETRAPGRCAGETIVRREWTATDRCGGSVSAVQTIEIRDTVPPDVRPLGAPACVWPPNHRYLCFTSLASLVAATDACSGSVRLRVAGCRSDQPDDQQGSEDRGIDGDGNTSNDCVVADDGSGFCIRSERLGQCKRGRTYSVVVRAEDECGNAAATTLALHVPHDQREHPDCAPDRPRELLRPDEPIPFAWTPIPDPDAGLPHPFTCP